MSKTRTAITDVPGILVGHAQDYDALTGCTVVICEKGAVGGVDQRGGAPGTRETDLLSTSHLVQEAHAILLSGGSAYGLDAAAGVMRYLEEKGIGFNAGVVRVPIVPAAILFDLDLGDSKIRPNAEMGYQACKNASSAPPLEGNHGAGTGATVGKILGPSQVMKGGIGTASVDVGKGVIVGAIMAVGAVGDVINSTNGEIIAGARSIKKGPIQIGQKGYFANTLEVLKSMTGRTLMEIRNWMNTVIGVVATNADLDKEHINKVAQMAHDGLARAIRPAHLMMDGDTIFALATGKKKADVNIVGAFAAQVVEEAIIRAVRNAEPVGEVPAAMK